MTLVNGRNRETPPHRQFRPDDVIKWKYFPRYWSFGRGIHRSPVDSPHKGQWREALFSSICAWTNDWANNRDDGDFRRHRAHHVVTVMTAIPIPSHPAHVKARFPIGNPPRLRWWQLNVRNRFKYPVYLAFCLYRCWFAEVAVYRILTGCLKSEVEECWCVRVPYTKYEKPNHSQYRFSGGTVFQLTGIIKLGHWWCSQDVNS